jgi:hypothetical protein
MYPEAFTSHFNSIADSRLNKSGHFTINRIRLTAARLTFFVKVILCHIP